MTRSTCRRGGILCRRLLTGALGPLVCVVAFTDPDASAITTDAKPPRRIVTLGAAVTETVYALGAGDEIVARDTSSTHPKEAQALPDAGYFRTIEAARILAQKPTLVLAAGGTGPDSQVALLEQSGVELVHLDERPSVDATVSMITRIGVVLHLEAEASRLVAALKTKLTTVRKRSTAAAAATGRTPRVAFLISMGPTTVQAAGFGTAADEVITLAGGANVFGDARNYKVVSAEALRARDPDVIFYAITSDVPAPLIPSWVSQTRAGREGRVQPLDLGFHLMFGPHLGEAVEAVSLLLFPFGPTGGG
ncbi:ABC transporter substrate-binding protein [Opitutaceae bacterium TAV4]|nr:ABC transporter substrate-binding protein [Opitutaceae bacterium TAV4]RRJ98583.1 ABC transporter substrate-binding protein [Opitutaceae bacterium TAV3]